MREAVPGHGAEEPTVPGENPVVAPCYKGRSGFIAGPLAWIFAS